MQPHQFVRMFGLAAALLLVAGVERAAATHQTTIVRPMAYDTSKAVGTSGTDAIRAAFDDKSRYDAGRWLPIPEPGVATLFLMGSVFAGTITRRKKRRHSADSRSRPLRIEPLEDRRLLSITVNTLVDEMDGSIIDGDISLRDAIVAAAPGETIDFDPSLTSGAPATLQLSTDGELFLNKSVTIDGPGAGLLTIQAYDPTPETANGDGSRVFHLDNGDGGTQINVEINGLTLTGGDVNAPGGAIFSYENLTIVDSNITGNSTSDVDGNSGGAIYSSGGMLAVTRTTISDNHTGDGGGAILQHNGQATITDSLIWNNTARFSGGGIFNDAGNMSVTNSTISANTAGYAGGGLFNRDGTATLDHLTITANSAPSGDGIASVGNSITHTNVHSSIVSGNDGAGNSDVEYLLGGVNSFTSQGYNLVTYGNAITAFAATGDLTGNYYFLNLAPLADNGGPTLTHATLPGSAAIDAGDPAELAGVGDVPLYDQRGMPYTRVFGGRSDIGAYERQNLGASQTYVVDTHADENDGDYSAGDLSLREAIVLANANADYVDTIEFAPALNGLMIHLSLGELVIDDPVAIEGPGADLLSIDALAKSRIFNFVTRASDFSIAGLTLIGGKTTGNLENGGAIASLSYGNLLIEGTEISGNSSYGGGGGIYAYGNVTLVGSQVSENSTTGDSANGGGVFSKGSVTLTDSTVTGNSTAGAASGGGGIRAFGDVTLTGSTVSGNATAGNFSFGGGVYAYGDVSLTGSTVSGNSTTGGFAKGGGVYSSGNVVLTGSTVSGNYTTGEDADGGGIQSQGNIMLTGSTVSGNHTSGDYSRGGGIGGTDVTLVDATISGNTTFGGNSDGGGIAAYGNATLLRSTITQNRTVDATSWGGGLWLNPFFGGSIATITDSILAGNTAGHSHPDLRPGLGSLTVDFSLIGDTSDLTVSEMAEISGGAGNRLNVDPLLGPLGHYGGPTETHALLAGSPAIDAGDPAAVAGAGDVPEFDERGTPYTRVFGGRIDMGAYERQSLSLVVDTLVDEDDGDYSAGDLSLREAIDLTNRNIGPTDTINFSPTLNGGTIELALGEILISDAVSINGPGPNCSRSRPMTRRPR